jgi:hypothetical protein
MPDLPEGEQGWGELAGSRPGQLVETRDGQRGTLAGTTGTRAFIKPAEGGSVIRAPLNDVRISQQPIAGATNPTSGLAAGTQREVSRGAGPGGASQFANEPGSRDQAAPVPGEGEGHVPPQGTAPEEETSSRSKPAKPEDLASVSAAQQALQKMTAKAEPRLSPEFRQAVENDAQLGYPGLSGIRPAKGLTRQERILEADFAQRIAQDPQAALATYHRMAQKDFGSENYISADLARELYPAYANDKAARLVLGRSTAAVTPYLAKLAFEETLAKGPTPEKPLALFLAGGPASGKTTVVNRRLSVTKQRSALVYDSPFANFKNARTAILQAIDAGFKPDVIFVYRPFELATRNMLERTVKEGRPVDPAYMARAHYEAQGTFLRLARELEDKANFTVWDNSGHVGDIQKISIDDLRNKSYINVKENEPSQPTGKESARASEEALRRLRDKGRAGSAQSPTPEGDGGERSGMGAATRPGHDAQSQLGRVGDETQRKAALRDYLLQQADAAYEKGEINAAEYRPILLGSGADELPAPK